MSRINLIGKELRQAKVLYGLLLDRMGLSVKNGWMDSEKRVYIYFTQEDAMNLMCGKDKATKLFRKLDKDGPRGSTVKNFILPPEPGQPQQPEQAPPPPHHSPPQAAKLTRCAVPSLPTVNAPPVCGGDSGRPNG